MSYAMNGNVLSVPGRWGWDSGEQITLFKWMETICPGCCPSQPSPCHKCSHSAFPARWHGDVVVLTSLVGMLWVLLKPLCCLSQRTQGMFLALLHRAGSTVGIQRKENPGKNYGCEGIFWYPLKDNTSNQRKGDFPIVEWSKHSAMICVCLNLNVEFN